MIKTKIVETTEKFDKEGKITERIVREEFTDDDTGYTQRTDKIRPEWVYHPDWIPWWQHQSLC